MKKIIQFWEEFRYKKTFIFGCFVIFVYFYDFSKYNNDFLLENGLDQNITILEIVNDDRKIVTISEEPMQPNEAWGVGCYDTLSVSAYGGSTLQVTVKNADNSIQTTSCEFNKKGNFITRFFGGRIVTATLDKDGHLKCKSQYSDGGPYCEEHGINDKRFQFKKLGE